MSHFHNIMRNTWSVITSSYIFSFGVCIVNANANTNTNMCTNLIGARKLIVSSFKNDAIWSKQKNKKKCAELNPCSLELSPNTEKENKTEQNKTNEFNWMRWKRAEKNEVNTKLESHSKWNERNGEVCFKRCALFDITVCCILIKRCWWASFVFYRCSTVAQKIHRPATKE